MRLTSPLAPSLLAASLVAFLPSPSMAQDVALADALFTKGVTDMQAGRFDTGCPALRESLKIDPQPGTLFTLAECEAQAGLYATAVARYEDYLQIYRRLPPDAQKRQLGREKIAASKKAELAPLVPMLTVTLAPSAPKGTRVMRDDVELSGPSLGLPLPVDPGEHVLVVIAPDRKPIERRIKLEKGDKKAEVLDVPAPEPPPKVEPDEAKKPPKPIEGTKPGPEVPPRDTGGGGGGRTAAYVIGGVGLAALGLGAVTGGMALGEKETIESHCDGEACDATGYAAAQRGQGLAVVSTIGFGVGLAGLATGVVLFLVNPGKDKKPNAARTFVHAGPTPSGGGMVVWGGAF